MISLQIYCDGSAQPNPGPCGYGIVALKENQKYLQLYEFIGEGTNQIAEMLALKQALLLAKDRPAIIYTDSQWSINLCSGKWSPHIYVQEWERIKQLKRKQHELRWVKGHSKVIFNEEVDKLAKQAVNLKAAKWQFLQEQIELTDKDAEKQWRLNLAINKSQALKIERSFKKNDQKYNHKFDRKQFWKNKMIQKKQKPGKQRAEKPKFKTPKQ